MIRLNLSTDYALRTLLYLASRPDEQVLTRDVSRFYDISGDHVSKVVQHLAQAGMVRAERGRNGGIRLGRPTSEITVWAVIELFEGPLALLDCVVSPGVCIIQPGCRLRKLLRQAGENLKNELIQVTLADLVSPRPDSDPLIQLSLPGVDAASSVPSGTERTRT